jgi:hypothetical protein
VTVLPTYDNDSLIAWVRSHGLGLTCGAGTALNAYRHDLVQLLEQAAAGRREYAVNAPPDAALALESEARQLETVIQLVQGAMSAMTAWLPSWRWTGEMTAAMEVQDR